MYTVTKYPHGTFSWADNSSSDPEAVKTFYMDLFGWSKVEVPIGENMTYTVFQLDGHDCAALSGMMPDQLQLDVPSQWNNFVTVDDVDALVDVVKAHGGSVVYGPEDVFDSGRMLHFQDPTGAALNMWQPYDTVGAKIVNTVGAMCWNELITNDIETAKAFYSAVFDWDYYSDEHYTHITNRGRNNGGMLQMAEMPPCWMVYFHVADIDAGIERVKELGGAVTVPKQEIPDSGWWSVVTDPAGAHFYIMQQVKTDPWIE